MKKFISLISLLILVFVSRSYSQIAYYAVLVGIEDYPGNENDLNYCIDDITDVQNMLIQVGNWSTSNMWILTNSQATESNILSKINTMKSYEDADDVCIFMFSGHGDNYNQGLVPYDNGNRITASELNNLFSGFDTNKILVILDACYSGLFDDQLSKGVVLMACQWNQLSWEGPSLQNGFFSYYVAEGMKGYADLLCSSISAEETFSYADPLVKSYTGNIQDPEDDDNYSNSLDAIVRTYTLSGSLSHDEIWSGTFNTTGSVTVGIDRTLEVLPSCTIKFASGTKLTVNGSLTILGSSGQHVIIDGQGYSRIGYSNAMIDIKDGATANIEYTDFINSPYDLIIRNSANATVSHCTFTNFGFDSNSRAITAYNSTGMVDISNCTFTGSGQNGYGVYATNTGANVTISGNTLTACRVGIRCYASNAFITSNTIQNSYYYGIQSDNVATNAQYRDNTICNNGYYGVYLNSSSPYLMYNYIYNNKVLINSGSPEFATPYSEGLGHRGYNTVTNVSAPLIKVQNYSAPYFKCKS